MHRSQFSLITVESLSSDFISHLLPQLPVQMSTKLDQLEIRSVLFAFRIEHSSRVISTFTTIDESKRVKSPTSRCFLVDGISCVCSANRAFHRAKSIGIVRAMTSDDDRRPRRKKSICLSLAVLSSAERLNFRCAVRIRVAAARNGQREYMSPDRR